ncbi:MAG: 4'-phosphopantetheinyl transferase superfamily protein [Verrucomicrobiota bacterium]
MKEIVFNSKVVTSLQHLRLTRPDKVYDAYFAVTKATLQDLEPLSDLYLEESERAYAQSLKFDRRRASYSLGRYCGKIALGAYLDESDLQKISIKAGVFGQPVVDYLRPHDAQVSIAHTESLGAALAFSEEHPMGLDVEVIDSSRDETIAKTFTEHESVLHSKLGIDQSSAYVLIWTIKEAVAKVLRTGITTPLKIFEVKELAREGKFWISSLKNFPQYKIYSYIEEGRACSIASPYKSIIDWRAV